MPILRQIAQLGQPVLRAPANPVTDPNAPAVRELIEDLLVTVADANGVGIAAPQVYEPLKLCIVASRPNPRYPHAPLVEPLVMLNPEIVRTSDEMDAGWEGCLSVPGIRGLVPRHRRIRVVYLSSAGESREEEFSDFLARIVQHEVDHLLGLVFLDRVATSRNLVTEKEYMRLVG